MVYFSFFSFLFMTLENVTEPPDTVCNIRLNVYHTAVSATSFFLENVVLPTGFRGERKECEAGRGVLYLYAQLAVSICPMVLYLYVQLAVSICPTVTYLYACHGVSICPARWVYSSVTIERGIVWMVETTEPEGRV